MVHQVLEVILQDGVVDGGGLGAYRTQELLTQFPFLFEGDDTRGGVAEYRQVVMFRHGNLRQQGQHNRENPVSVIHGNKETCLFGSYGL